MQNTMDPWKFYESHMQSCRFSHLALHIICVPNSNISTPSCVKGRNIYLWRFVCFLESAWYLLLPKLQLFFRVLICGLFSLLKKEDDSGSSPKNHRSKSCRRAQKSPHKKMKCKLFVFVLSWTFSFNLSFTLTSIIPYFIGWLSFYNI